MYTENIVRYEIKPNTFLSISVRSNIKTGRGNFSQIRLKSTLVKHEEIRSIEAYLDRRKEENGARPKTHSDIDFHSAGMQLVNKRWRVLKDIRE